VSNRTIQIGFSQRIRLEWLEHTAALRLTGKEGEPVIHALQQLLREKLSVGGKAVRGNREKAITILMKIWINVPPGLELMRKDGLEILKGLPQGDHIAVHWGMTMAVYPFWAAVATQVGRLLRLQGTAAAAQVQRRLREQYGERETVSRAARRILRTFVDWGVLVETDKRGVYRQGLARTIADLKLTAWLVEASLRASSNGAVPLNALVGAANLFPFHLARISANHLVAANRRLELITQGLDQELVTVKRS
jgi:hypothetical protein